MRHAVPFLLALASCAAEPTLTSSVPMGASPPPAWPALGLRVSAIQGGTTATFRVDGLAPGESVYVLRAADTASPGVCSPAAGGMCTELAAPVAVLGAAIADGQGEATLQLTVPLALRAGRDVAFQAAAIRGAGGAQSVRSPAIRRVTGAPAPDAVHDLLPGELVITEVFADPTAVDDAVGEWFEVANLSGRDVDLAGLVVDDGAGDRFVVSTSALAGVGQRVVFGVNGDPAVNGGVDVDVVTTGISLDDVDALALVAPGGLLDAVAWDGGPQFPATPGAAMRLDPRYTDAADNDQGAAWCAADPSPGAVNDLCPMANCGDGVLDPGEACDDGGVAPGDGCDALCQLEGCPLPTVTTGRWNLTQPGRPTAYVRPGLDGDLFVHDYGNDFWMARLDAGTLSTLWSRQLTTVNDSVPLLVPREDGGVGLFTTVYATPYAVGTAAVFDPQGDLEVGRQAYETPNHDDFLVYDATATSDGGYLMVGQSDGWAAYMVRLDANLDVVWEQDRYLDPPHNAYNAFLRVHELDDGGFVLLGRRAWIHRVDADGVALWSRVTQDPTLELRDLVVAADGGTWSVAQDGNEDLHLLRHDAAGTLRWARLLAPGAGQRPVWSTSATHLAAVPATCGAPTQHGDACGLPGDRCATAVDTCTCSPGGTWACAPGEQSVVMSWRATGAGGAGAALSIVDGDGAAVRSVIVDPTTEVRTLWVGAQGDVNTFTAYERLVRLDEGLSGACAVIELPDVEWVGSTVTTAPVPSKQFGGFPFFTVRQQPLSALVSPYAAPQVTVTCTADVCP